MHICRDDFVEFANFTFHEYGHKVKQWITINEPWVFSRAGYDIGKKAPGRCSKYVNKTCLGGSSGHELYIVSHHLLLAHAEAVHEFRKCAKVYTKMFIFTNIGPLLFTALIFILIHQMLL